MDKTLSKIHFSFNVNHIGEQRIEIPIGLANIDSALTELKRNKILYIMGFNFRKSNCYHCDEQPGCKICIRNNDHISASSNMHLFWIQRIILNSIANKLESKYAKKR